MLSESTPQHRHPGVGEDQDARAVPFEGRAFHHQLPRRASQQDAHQGVRDLDARDCHRAALNQNCGPVDPMELQPHKCHARAGHFEQRCILEKIGVNRGRPTAVDDDSRGIDQGGQRRANRDVMRLELNARAASNQVGVENCLAKGPDSDIFIVADHGHRGSLELVDRFSRRVDPVCGCTCHHRHEQERQERNVAAIKRHRFPYAGSHGLASAAPFVSGESK